MVASESQIAKLLRERHSSLEAGLRALFQAALESGQRQAVTAANLDLVLYPLRGDRRVVGLLSMEVPTDSPVTEDKRPADDGSRVERGGQPVRAGTDVDMIPSVPVADERRHARRLLAVLRFLTYLAGLDTDQELIAAIIQAGAVWYDVDAWTYRRTVQGSFVLDGWLPGADLSTRPAELPAAAALLCDRITRVSSIQRLEELGWRDPRGEILLVPIMCAGQLQWIIAIGGSLDDEVESTYGALSVVLPGLLEGLVARRVREIDDRLQPVLRSHGLPAKDPEGLWTALVKVLAAGVSADSGRLIMETSEGQVTLAFTGGTGIPSPDSASPQEASGTGERLHFQVPLGEDRRVTLELTAAAGSPFRPVQVMALDVTVRSLQAWLSATFDKAAEPAGGPAVLKGFELHVEEELVRARRFNPEVALLLIAGYPDRGSSTVEVDDTLAATLRTELRPWDLVGTFQTGEVGILLMHTGAQSTAAVARRLRARLSALFPVQPLRIAQAALPLSKASVAGLVSAARRGDVVAEQ